MIDPTSDEYFDTASICEDCGGEPEGYVFGCDWGHCPKHGTKLQSQGDIEDAEVQAGAEETPLFKVGRDLVRMVS